LTQYFLIRSGQQGVHLDECLAKGFVGLNYGIDEDLSGQFPENWQDFNSKYIPKWMESHPGGSKIAAGLACAALWTVGRGFIDGDVVITPNAGASTYQVGVIAGPYKYAGDSPLPHQRPVTWLNKNIERNAMSQALKRSTAGTLSLMNQTNFAAELEGLIGGVAQPAIVATNKEIEDPVNFVLESHLEDFLVENWDKTILGRTHDIYSEGEEIRGQQFPTDTGRIDVLAISKDRKELVVVELKKGRASDAVVGQIQRYMGYIQDELLETGQTVRGIIIALDEDSRIKRALAVAPNIDFYRYKVSFDLHQH
jgi:restriction system protein